ncbi:hypothetical protein AVEN_159262-1, partial [Araneus ventricosus]
KQQILIKNVFFF